MTVAQVQSQAEKWLFSQPQWLWDPPIQHGSGVHPASTALWLTQPRLINWYQTIFRFFCKFLREKRNWPTPVHYVVACNMWTTSTSLSNSSILPRDFYLCSFLLHLLPVQVSRDSTLYTEPVIASVLTHSLSWCVPTFLYGYDSNIIIASNLRQMHD